MMEFGVYHEFPSVDGRPDREAFNQAFALVDAAEDWGLDVLWLAELHFDPARSVLSAPLCVASAIAARTRRIRIGIAVQVLPLGNPLRIAEEAATVDQISQGRLILGVGRSGVARTYEAYNIPYGESRERFTETLAIIQQAWTHPAVSYAGTFHRFENVSVTPRPFQPSGPPIRIAATSPDTFVTIGRQGKPIFLGVKFEDAREQAANIDAYRAAWRAAGHPGHGAVYLRAPGHVAASNATARAEAEGSLLHFYRAQADLLTDTLKRTGADASDKRFEAAARLRSMTYDEALRGTVLIGTPDQVTHQIRTLRSDLGLDGVMLETNCGGLIPGVREKASLHLLCQEVMPHFR